jgi:predicted aspartyl protease
MIAPFRVENDSIVVPGTVNGHDVEFVIDTGDALGPTLNSADAEAAGVNATESVDIEGAGGESSVTQGEATVEMGDSTFTNETVFVDSDLSGPSLLGLPFFLSKAPHDLDFNFGAGYLVAS